MQSFPHQLSAWLPYFTTLTMACATLAGLRFVALSLHANTLRNEENANLRRLANHTFGDFVTIMFIGLFFIGPWIAPATPAVGALITTVLAFVYTLKDAWELLRHREQLQHRKYLITRLRVAVLGLLLILVGAVELWYPLIIFNFGRYVENPSFTLIFAGTVVLLVSAMKNTWYLLAHELRK